MNKKCRYNSMLSAFMDEQLPDLQAEDLRAHMRECESCKKEMEALRATDALLRSLPDIEPSADFDRVFRKRLIEEDQRKVRWSLSSFLFRGWRPALAGAASVLLVAGYFLLQGDRTVLTTEEVLIVENMELLKDFEIVHNLDLLENWDEIVKPGAES